MSAMIGSSDWPCWLAEVVFFFFSTRTLLGALYLVLMDFHVRTVQQQGAAQCKASGAKTHSAAPRGVYATSSQQGEYTLHIM